MGGEHDAASKCTTPLTSAVAGASPEAASEQTPANGELQGHSAQTPRVQAWDMVLQASLWWDAMEQATEQTEETPPNHSVFYSSHR